MSPSRKNQIKRLVKNNVPASVNYWSDVVEVIDDLNFKIHDFQFKLEGIGDVSFPTKSDVEHLDKEFYYGKTTNVDLLVRDNGIIQDKIRFHLSLVPLETKIEITAYFTA